MESCDVRCSLKIIVTCTWKVVVLDAFKIHTTFFVCAGQQKGFGNDRKFELEALKKSKTWTTK